MDDAHIQALEQVSATLLGMNFDNRIPPDARAVLVKMSEKVDAVTEAINDEKE